jgi:hypothetical protein
MSIASEFQAHDGLTAEAENGMNIAHAGSQPSNNGPADWFTGTVRIDPLFTAPGRATWSGSRLTRSTGTARRPPRR